jgi:hypothetical protein
MNSLSQTPVAMPLLRTFPHCAIPFTRNVSWLAALVLCTARGSFAEYRIERIASGLNQPTSVAFAPGDNNTMYILERTQNNNVNMGKVLKYDIATRTKTTILDLGSRAVGGGASDLGATCLVFHPEFNDPTSSGYQKFYLSSTTFDQAANPAATNRVEEYTLGAGGQATFSRTILQYPNTRPFHTTDWLGFDPTATGAARNYLWITEGDGGPQIMSGAVVNASYVPRAQDLNEIYGKMLRVDLTGDAYPADSLKNYTIPADNPIPAWNTAHPGNPISGLGEVVASGFRNPWRVSFDRLTGDLYIGDVGSQTTLPLANANNFVSMEEVNFLKAGSLVAGIPPDFGFSKREGTQSTPGTLGGPQGSSLNPIIQKSHSPDGDFAAIGGYLYRGPVAELYGKYIYSDEISKRRYVVDFDRNTDPTTFNGNNATVTDMASQFESLIVDPTDPTYTQANVGASFGLDYVASYGEDAMGNLYFLDFAWSAPYASNEGEIFRLVPVQVPEPSSAVLATLLSVSFAAAFRRRRISVPGKRH